MTRQKKVIIKCKLHAHVPGSKPVPIQQGQDQSAMLANNVSIKNIFKTNSKFTQAYCTKHFCIAMLFLINYVELIAFESLVSHQSTIVPSCTWSLAVYIHICSHSNKSLHIYINWKCFFYLKWVQGKVQCRLVYHF